MLMHMNGIIWYNKLYAGYVRDSLWHFFLPWMFPRNSCNRQIDSVCLLSYEESVTYLSQSMPGIEIL